MLKNSGQFRIQSCEPLFELESEMQKLSPLPLGVAFGAAGVVFYVGCMIFMATAITGIQWLLDRDRWRFCGEFTFIGITSVLFAVPLGLDRGHRVAAAMLTRRDNSSRPWLGPPCRGAPSSDHHALTRSLKWWWQGNHHRHHFEESLEDRDLIPQTGR